MTTDGELQLPAWCRKKEGGSVLADGGRTDAIRALPRWMSAALKKTGSLTVLADWQRTLDKFQTHLKRLLQLSGSYERKLGSLENEIVSGFSYTMGGAGSTMLDYLRSKGETVHDESEALRKACYQRIITNNQVWLAMMQMQHQLSNQRFVPEEEQKWLADRVVEDGYLGEFTNLERFFVEERDRDLKLIER